MPRAVISNGLPVLQKPTMPDDNNDNNSALGVLILAGGQSQRMGMDKALLPFKQRTFLKCIVDQCVCLSRHIAISIGRDQQQTLKGRFESCVEFGQVTWIEDEYQNKGPLAGITAGLKALEPVCRYAFVIGCDVPIVKHELAEELLRIAQQHDSRAVTPVDGQRTFGMTAVYRTDSWQAANKLIQQNSLRVSLMAEQLSATKVELKALRTFDPKLESFLNINHPQAYRQFMASQGYDVDSDLIVRLSDSAR